jgi:hypothetical protein
MHSLNHSEKQKNIFLPGPSGNLGNGKYWFGNVGRRHTLCILFFSSLRFGHYIELFQAELFILAFSQKKTQWLKANYLAVDSK